jgi:hypothetical protein
MINRGCKRAEKGLVDDLEMIEVRE